MLSAVDPSPEAAAALVVAEDARVASVAAYRVAELQNERIEQTVPDPERFARRLALALRAAVRLA